MPRPAGTVNRKARLVFLELVRAVENALREAQQECARAPEYSYARAVAMLRDRIPALAHSLAVALRKPHLADELGRVAQGILYERDADAHDFARRMEKAIEALPQGGKP
jgi:hypothetical protein